MDTIHDGKYNVAFGVSNGKKLLCVCYKNKQGGVVLWEDDAIKWREAIETAMDKEESDLLARVILNQ